MRAVIAAALAGAMTAVLAQVPTINVEGGTAAFVMVGLTAALQGLDKYFRDAGLYPNVLEK